MNSEIWYEMLRFELVKVGIDFFLLVSVLCIMLIKWLIDEHKDRENERRHNEQETSKE